MYQTYCPGGCLSGPGSVFGGPGGGFKTSIRSCNTAAGKKLAFRYQCIRICVYITYTEEKIPPALGFLAITRYPGHL